jgi:hypothetical protein
MNNLIFILTSFLDTPVPHAYIPPSDLQYAFVVLGGMLILVLLPWLLFCFVMRNGIDGTKAVVRAIKHKKPLQVGAILIGKWKPLHDYDPVKPYVPGLEETWRSL